MKNIELLEKQVETVTTKTYKLLVGDPKRGITFTWIDYLNQDGKVMDSVFRDERGREVSMDNAAFTEEVEAFIDGLENKEVQK